MPNNDSLEYLAGHPAFSLEWHLFDPVNNVPVYGYLELGKLFLMKDPSGHPSDIYLFDDSYVYQKATENSAAYADPTAFKAFMSSSTPNGGILWCPREMQPEGTPVIFPTPDSSYGIYQNCALVGTKANLGLVQAIASGPWVINIGGDLGMEECLLVEYQWDNLAVRESFYYARYYGQVRWTTENLVADAYVLQKSVTYNKIVRGGSPTPVFPCNLP